MKDSMSKMECFTAKPMASVSTSAVRIPPNSYKNEKPRRAGLSQYPLIKGFGMSFILCSVYEGAAVLEDDHALSVLFD